MSADGVNWEAPVASGSFTNNATEKEILFASKTGRYIRLRALTEVNGNPWTSMAEINVLGQIQAQNSAPAALNDTVITSEDSALTVNVLANDSDADGDPLTLSSITQPLN